MNRGSQVKFAFMFLAVAIICIGMVSAVGDYDKETEIRFVGKQSTNLSVWDTCTDNGFDCDSSYNCSFTIIDPDQQIIINSIKSTKDGDLYVYNLTSIQTSKIGTHEVNSYCTDGVDSGRSTFYYEITQNGIMLDSGQGLIYGVVLLMVIVLFIFTLSKLGSSENYGVNLLLVNVGYILLNIVFLIVWKISEGFLASIPFLGQAFRVLWFTSTLAAFPLLIYEIFILMLRSMDENTKMKLFGRGYSEEDATRISKRR